MEMTRLGGAGNVSGWRLSAGAALVSCGVLIVALGAANVAGAVLATLGVSGDAAGWFGIAAAGLLVPSILYALSTQLYTPAPYNRAINFGTGIAVLGLAGFVLTVPLSTTVPLAIFAALPYAAGVVLSLWAIVASAATAPVSPRLNVQTTSETQPEHRSAADGGEDNSDLSFPFDEKE